MLELLANPIELQKNSFLKFAKSLKEDKGQHMFIDNVSSLRMDVIKEIENKDLYTIFIRNKKAEINVHIQYFGQQPPQIK